MQLLKSFFAVVIVMAFAFGGLYLYQRTHLLERLGVPGATAQSRTYYQYVDDTGRLRFAESLEAVPERWRDRAGRIELDRPPAEAAAAARQTAAPPKTSAEGDAPTAAHVPAPATGAVVIYTKNDCASCAKALRHLQNKEVDYVERNIDEDASAEAAYRQKAGFAGPIPLIEVGHQVVEGYDRARLNAALTGE